MSEAAQIDAPAKLVVLAAVIWLFDTTTTSSWMLECEPLLDTFMAWLFMPSHAPL